MARLLSLGCRPKWSLRSTVSRFVPWEHVTLRFLEAAFVEFLPIASTDMQETVSVPGWYEQLRASGWTGRTRPTMTAATRRVGRTAILR